MIQLTHITITLSLNGIISMKENSHGKNKYYAVISVDKY
jgi:hypothetical protein